LPGFPSFPILCLPLVSHNHSQIHVTDVHLASLWVEHSSDPWRCYVVHIRKDNYWSMVSTFSHFPAQNTCFLPSMWSKGRTSVTHIRICTLVASLIIVPMGKAPHSLEVFFPQLCVHRVWLLWAC
jgi:hypothetical protein